MTVQRLWPRDDALAAGSRLPDTATSAQARKGLRFGPNTYDIYVPSGMFAHYLGSTLDSGDMSVWLDSSGNARHLLLQSGDIAPPHDSDAVNGQPGLSVTSATQFDYMASFAAVTPERLTMYVVADWSTAANVLLAQFDDGSDPTASLNVETFSTPSLLAYTPDSYTEASVVLTGDCLLTAHVDATETRTRFNDDTEEADVGSVLSAVSRILFNTGAAAVTWGSIAEIRVYDQTHDEAAVRAELNTTYALGLTD